MARRALDRNRALLEDPDRRWLVAPSYLRTLETSVEAFEEDLARLKGRKPAKGLKATMLYRLVTTALVRLDW
jgi:hypothetical protein